MTIIYAILIFCLLIFVHEFGHFIAAKACGVKVNEFAIGMGPTFFKKAERGNTVFPANFSLSAVSVPWKGKMKTEDERAFNNKPAWQRACVLAAGPFMNLLTAMLLLVVIATWAGQPTTTINKVIDGSPAYEAGLQKGDEILGIDGKKIDEWNDLLTVVGQTKNDTVSFELDRDGKKMTIQSRVEYDEQAQRNKVGVSPVFKHSLAEGTVNGVKNTGKMTIMMYDILKKLVTGEVSVKELSGPVGIVYAVNDSAKAGVIYVIYLSALLSLNLAIMNLLPLPALDGGRLLFLVIRKFTGKRMTDEMEGKVHFVGIMLLLLLMVYVTWNDIVRFVVPIFS